MTIGDQEDLGDAASRKANREHLESRRRSMTARGRWMPLHPFKATPGERVLACLGAVMLVAVLIAFALQAMGVIR